MAVNYADNIAKAMEAAKNSAALLKAANAAKTPTTTQPTSTASTASNPYTPRGGIDYNTATTDQKKSISENEQRIRNDAAYRQSELERTQGVIAGMGNNVGQAQLDYLAKLKALSAPQPQQQVAGPLPQQSTSVPGSDYIENLRRLASEGAQAQAYDSRNQADAINLQNARGLQEIMANRGLGASGENITAMLSQAANRSNSLNSINNQLASDLRGIDISNNEQLLNNLYRNQDVDYRNKVFDWTQQMDMANQTGLINGAKTLAGQQFDRGIAESDRNYNYQIGRDKVNDAQQQWQNNFNQASFDWNKAQTAWENSFKNRSFEQDMKDAAASRGLQWASLSQRDKEFVAEQAYREKTYQQDLGEAAGKRVSGAIDQLQGQYVSRDPSTGSITVTNPQALRSAVIAKGLADNETDEILIFFGLPTN